MNLKIWMLVLSCTFKSVSIHAVYTAQKMKFSIKNFFNKCDQIRRDVRIWSHLLKKFLMENFSFCAVIHRHESARILSRPCNGLRCTAQILCLVSGSRYSKMEQVNFLEGSLWKIWSDMVWLATITFHCIVHFVIVQPFK